MGVRTSGTRRSTAPVGPIEIEPDYAPALARLATLSAERIISLASGDLASDHATALESAERAYRLASFDPYVLMNCGQAWSLSGEASRARRMLDQAIEMVPYDLLAHFFHANHIAVWGSESDAAATVQLLPPLLAQHRSHPVTLLLRGSLALCQLRVRAEDEATAGLRECYEAAPGLPSFATVLAAVLLRRGEAREAGRIVEHLAALGFDVSDAYRERWRALGPTLGRFEALLG